MDKIYQSISQLIIDTGGGILILWLGAALILKKVLRWCGTKIAEGANNDLVAKLMPQLEAKFDDKLSNFASELRKEISPYKEKKHKIEGELEALKEAIIANDLEVLSALRIIFIKRRNECID